MHKNNKRILSMCTVASVLLTSSLTSVKVSAANPPENPRLWGADRYETALKISQEGWTSSEYVVIASGEGYADALSAAPLAKVKNAPIILTAKNSISENSLKELKRLGAKHVYIVGGEGAVSKEVESKIKSVVETIERLDGKDRYETSVKIAEKLGKVDKAIIASGQGYADALSAAPVAAIKGIPVLLTKTNELPSKTQEYLKSAGVTTTFVIGGTAVVSEGVVKVLPQAKRVGGKNRFETNAEVLRAFATEFDFANAYLALGGGTGRDEFADALAGSSLAAKNSAPVILTGKALQKETKEIAKEKLSPTTTFTVLGGKANVADSLVNSIKITAEALDKEGTAYDKDYAGNAVITGKNITFKDSTVKGNLYVEGNNASLTNLKVEGTIFVNPGKDGEATLDNVTADKIVVLSGAENTIRFKNVKANNLTAISRVVARLLVEGGTEIKATSVLSNIILEGKGGSFGNVNIPKTVLDKVVELRGTIDKPVVIAGNVELKAASGANLAKVEVRSEASEKVVLGGNLGTVEVHTAADIKMAAGASATIKAMTEEAKKSAKVEISSGAYVTTDGIAKDNIVGTPSTPGGGGGGGGSVTTKTYSLKYGIVSVDLGADAKISDVYDTVKTNAQIKSTLKSKIQLAFEKAEKYNVGTEKLVEFVVRELNLVNAESKVADLIQAKDVDGLVNYVTTKSFDDLYSLALDRISEIGLKEIPEITSDTTGTAINTVTVKNNTTGTSYTKKPGDIINPETAKANIKALLGITKDTKLSELMTKDLSITVTTTKEDETPGKTYTLTVKGGVVETNFGKGYKIELVAK